MYILNKIGEEVNRATYSYICETEEDLQSIPQNKMNIGSTAIVVNEGEMKIFLANGNNEWVEFDDTSTAGGSGSSTPSPSPKPDIKPEPQPEKEESKYEVLNEITVEDSYNTITLTQDDEGNAYDLSSVYLTFTFPKATKTSALSVKLNDIVCANISSAMSSASTSKINSSFAAEIKGGRIFAEATSASSNTTAQVAKSAYNGMSQGKADSITSIEISTVALNNFPKNSVITVEGCRR